MKLGSLTGILLLNRWLKAAFARSFICNMVCWGNKFQSEIPFCALLLPLLLLLLLLSRFSRVRLCDPIDSSPPGSPVSGILQARTLEWVAISFTSAWKWKVKVKSLSRVRLLATPWTAAHQAPPSMGFSRQEYWSGVPLPSPFLLLPKKKNKSSVKRFLH